MKSSFFTTKSFMKQLYVKNLILLLFKKEQDSGGFEQITG